MQNIKTGTARHPVRGAPRKRTIFYLSPRPPPPSPRGGSTTAHVPHVSGASGTFSVHAQAEVRLTPPRTASQAQGGLVGSTFSSRTAAHPTHALSQSPATSALRPSSMPVASSKQVRCRARHPSHLTRPHEYGRRSTFRPFVQRLSTTLDSGYRSALQI